MNNRVFHVLKWSLLFYYIYGPMQDVAASGDLRELYSFFTNRTEALLTWTTIIPFVGFSLCAYLIFFYFYHRYQLWQTLMACITSAVLMIGLRYLLQEIIMPATFGFRNYSEGYPLHLYVIDNLYYAFLFTAFGLVIYFIQYGKYRQSLSQKLEIENQQMELSLLRAQINPHFLFNALNSIYALVNEKNDKALPALDNLNRVLRYSLYTSDEFVALSKEWSFIEDFIELQSMRWPKAPALLVELPHKFPEVKIPSFVLLTFIENAFKHGELQDTNHPLRISLEIDNQELHFTVRNKIKEQNRDRTRGIGIDNTKQRLDLLFGHSYTLKTGVLENDYFEVKMIIPLQLCSDASS